MTTWDLDAHNPLASDSPRDWERLLEAMGPASLLVVANAQLGAHLWKRMDAEDLIQEALLQVWRGRGRIEWQGLAAFRAYFLTVLRNRICDASDKERALKRGGLHDMESLAPPAARNESANVELPGAISTTPSRIASNRERANAMTAALHSLPPELRDVLRLRLFEERSSAEVATELGLGLSAVKHRFVKAARLYRDQLRHEFASQLGRSTEIP